MTKFRVGDRVEMNVRTSAEEGGVGTVRHLRYLVSIGGLPVDHDPIVEVDLDNGHQLAVWPNQLRRAEQTKRG